MAAMFNKTPKFLPRYAVVSRRSEFDEVVLGLMRVVAESMKSLPSSGTPSRPSDAGVAELALTKGGSFGVDLANLRSPALLEAVGTVTAGFVLSFDDVPMKSPIDETYVRGFYKSVATAINAKLVDLPPELRLCGQVKHRPS